MVEGQESKLCSGESKTSNILTIAFVQAVGHSFFQFPLSFFSPSLKLKEGANVH